MLGISIYLSSESIESKEPYINKMNKLGFNSIFTSLHIPEDNPATYKESLQKLGTIAQKYEMELFADISPKSLEYLGFNWENADKLQVWGLTGVRVDYGVPEETIAQLSNKMKIALNASTITKENIKKLRKHHATFSSIEAWHNYYPRPETGLDVEDFKEKNQFLKDEGLKVMAFIPGDGEKRGPIYQGLPTIEAHRDRSTFSSFLDFYHNNSVDKILIGDPSINEVSEIQFKAFKEDKILLRAQIFTENESIKVRLQDTQTNRLDAARDVIRSAESRQYARIGDYPLPANHTIERKQGSITIDNEKYGRYQGEIQLTKRTLPADEKVNVIGRVVEEDRWLLPYIMGGVAFCIDWVD